MKGNYMLHFRKSVASWLRESGYFLLCDIYELHLIPDAVSSVHEQHWPHGATPAEGH